MAMTVEDCKAIVEAKRKARKVYMMMETALYTREFLYGVKSCESGKLGRIQFVRGSHIQDMSMEGRADLERLPTHAQWYPCLFRRCCV